MKYDFCCVGAGLFSLVFAHEAITAGKTCLLIEKRNVLGGNIAVRNWNGIQVHQYGPHIFHTDSPLIWQYVNNITEFVPYQLNVLAQIDHKMYNLPFNMHTFQQVFYTTDMCMIKEMISIGQGTDLPNNLESAAISQVGPVLYNLFIKGYTEKQWGCSCDALPPEIMTRIPVRYEFNNNYFDDTYSGIPDYTHFISGLAAGYIKRESISDCITHPGRHDYVCGVDALDCRDALEQLASTIIYTGRIDEFFDYELGQLPYRCTRFGHACTKGSLQHAAVVNYPESTVPYTRATEHKYFDRRTCDLPCTIVTYEYPGEGDEPCYPIPTAQNKELYKKYVDLAHSRTPNIIFAGRLGSYAYVDMDDTVCAALTLFQKLTLIQ